MDAPNRPARPTLQDAWGRRAGWALALWPVSLLLGAVVRLRRQLYRKGWLRQERLPVPVLVVGNVVAGGAGKTPVVVALVDHLRARGLSPGIVSRGYGRRTHDCREVRADSPAEDVGDEPLLLARRCQVPVFVATRRAQAGRALLQAYPATQVLVCDDGLQHLALERDLDICVFDERGIGNGWLLPAGPLREPWPRPVDLVLRPEGVPLEGLRIARGLAPLAVRADGTREALVTLSREPRLVAVAGIARPQAFFDMLAQAGVRPSRHIALPDHHDFIAHPPAIAPEERIVCTEKDAVKLWRLRPDAWAAPLSIEIESGFWQAIDRLCAQLSSRHGSQTARAAGLPRDQGLPRL